MTLQKPKYPVKKWAEDMSGHFSKEDVRVANGHMRGCSASLIIGEVQIGAVMRYHLLPVRKAKIKNTGDKC